MIGGEAPDENISHGYVHCPRLGEDSSALHTWAVGEVIAQFNLRA